MNGDETIVKIYFTADCHFDHANIIKYAHRPFLQKDDLINETEWASEQIKEKRCQLMNEELVRRWNQLVHPQDVVYHIGDFSFKGSENAKKWEQRLHGSIVHFQGNHDKNNGVNTYLQKGILVFGKKIVFAQHHPPQDGNDIPKECDFVICGHVHDTWKHKLIENIPVINVGVDVWDFKPIDSNQLVSFYLKILKQRKQ
jgi:calcineurin-like phosphoesterase family protein